MGYNRAKKKMKKVFYTVAVLALGIIAQSCAALGSSSPAVFYDGRSVPVTATSNTLSKSAKVGVSKQLNVLGLVATGDSGIAKAAKEAGITKISVVDQKTKSILGLFCKTETIVYGD